MRLCGERRISLRPNCWLRDFEQFRAERRSEDEEERLRSGVIFELTVTSRRAIDRLLRTRSDATSPSIAGISSLRRKSSDYVPHESTAIFDSQDPSRGDESLARSRDGNWDRSVKGLFDDREREIPSKSS